MREWIPVILGVILLGTTYILDLIEKIKRRKKK